MVAVKVESLLSQQILVTTLAPSLSVLISKPVGVLKLSGETALRIESAILALAYSSVIIACKFLAF